MDSLNISDMEPHFIEKRYANSALQKFIAAPLQVLRSITLPKLKIILSFPKLPTHILGNQGERAARRFLKRNGYRIVANNWVSPLGEIDIIARKGRTLIFCEVKTLRHREKSNFEAGDKVDYKKQEKIKRLADLFCDLNRTLLRRSRLKEIRFDVIGIEKIGLLKYRFDHRIDAF